MNQPEVHVAARLGVCGAQRFAPVLRDEVLYDVHVYEIGVRTHFAEEYVRVAIRPFMNKELYICHMRLNRVEQLCGLLQWQAMLCIADFNKAHRVHPDRFKSMLHPTGNGIELVLTMSTARLVSLQAYIQRCKDHCHL